MTVWFFIHSIAKRAEAIALVDSGATENFMNLIYAKWLRLSIKRMSTPRKLFNVDGTKNKSGELQHYVDLQTRTGTHTTTLRFFLSDLEEHKVILKYPWFAAVQPKIDWKQEWINHIQLPIILWADNAKKAIFIPCNKNIPQSSPPNQYYIGSITIHPNKPKTPLTNQLSKEYQHHKKVFSKEQSRRLPKHTIWNHAIKLLLNAPATLLAQLIPLNLKEREEMHKFIAEHLRRGMIQESKSPYVASFFFIKKKDGK